MVVYGMRVGWVLVVVATVVVAIGIFLLYDTPAPVCGAGGHKPVGSALSGGVHGVLGLCRGESSDQAQRASLGGVAWPSVVPYDS